MVTEYVDEKPWKCHYCTCRFLPIMKAGPFRGKYAVIRFQVRGRDVEAHVACAWDAYRRRDDVLALFVKENPDDTAVPMIAVV